MESHKSTLESCSREEGELSDDDQNEETYTGRSRNWSGVNQSDWGKRAKQFFDYGTRDRHGLNSIFDPAYMNVKPHNVNKSGGRSTETSPHRQLAGHSRSKRAYQERKRTENSTDCSQQAHSKIWENHRFRRASSVRASSPVMADRVSSPNWHEGEDEYDQLMRDYKRIQAQLKNLEYEEEKSQTCYGDHENGEEKGNKLIAQGQLLEEIERLNELPDSDTQIEHVVMEMEDISEDEDFDEQELRRLALATSARHNQLIAAEIEKEPVLVVQPDSPSVPCAQSDVVVIPDVESAKDPEPVVVVVEEEENLVGKSKHQPKGEGKKSSHKKTSSKSSKKTHSHGKRKKKEVSKAGSKTSSPSSSKGKLKGSMSKKDLHLQQKILHALGMKNTEKAMEKLNRLFKEPSAASQPPPKPTGTMGDFKRQNRLPLLNKTQNVQGSKDKTLVYIEEKKDATTKRKQSQSMQDNYEEVEMDIESDKEDNAAENGKRNFALETLNLGLDFNQAMQPIPSVMYGASGQMYQANQFMSMSTMNSLPSYAEQNLQAIPLPPLPPLPSQPPPLPPSQPPQPPIPKSPPPPVPPPPPLPLSLQATTTSNPSFLANANVPFVQAPNLCQQNLSPHIPYGPVPFSSSLSSVAQSFQTSYPSNIVAMSFRTSQLPMTNDVTPQSPYTEKNNENSSNVIDSMLHKYRHGAISNEDKETKKKVDIVQQSIFDELSKLRRVATKAIEAESGYSSSQQKKQDVANNFVSNTGQDPREHPVIPKEVSDHDFDREQKISFRINSTSRDDAYYKISNSQDNTADKLNRNVKPLYHESAIDKCDSDSRVRREKHRSDHSSSVNSPYRSHIRSAQHSPSSSSYHSRSSSRRHSPKRKREPNSIREELLLRQRRRSQVSGCDEYEPDSPQRKHPRLQSPPLYIPTKTFSNKEAEDKKDEIQKQINGDGESDNDDDDDADFLRKQLLSDMIKRKNVDVERESSVDSSHEDQLSPKPERITTDCRVEVPHTILVSEPSDYSKQSARNTHDGADITANVPADKSSSVQKPDSESGDDGQEDNVKENTRDKEEESDEDGLVPPPVVNRVWNLPKLSAENPPTDAIDGPSANNVSVIQEETINLQSTYPFASLSHLAEPHKDIERATSNIKVPSSSLFPLSPSPSNRDSPTTCLSESKKDSTSYKPSPDVGGANNMNNMSLYLQSSKSKDNLVGSSLTISSPSSSTDAEKLAYVGQSNELTGHREILSIHSDQKSNSSSSEYVSPTPNINSNLSFGERLPPVSVPSTLSSSLYVNKSPSTPPTLLKATTVSTLPVPIVTPQAASIAQHHEKVILQHSVIQRAIEATPDRSSARNSSPMRESSNSAAQKPLPKYPTVIIPPVHPSVIVPLNTSSDEEDQEESGGQTSQNTDDNQSEITHLWKEDKDLCLKKKTILVGQEKLKSLVNKINLRHKLQEKSVVKIQALDKQIAQLNEEKLTVEKVAMSHKAVVLKTKVEFQALKSQLIDMRHSFLERAKALMDEGQALVGQGFIPTALRSTHNNQTVSKNHSTPSTPLQQINKVQQIAAEKKKLKEKEKAIAEKLKRLKENSMQGMIRRVFKKSSKIKTSKSPKSGSGADVIQLGKDSNQDMVIQRQRRKSILNSEYSSTTPNLPKTPKRSISSESGECISMEKKNETLSRKDKDTDVFKMPSDSQLANLRKLQEEKVEKVFKNSASHMYISDPDVFISFASLSEGELKNANAVKGKGPYLTNQSGPTPLTYKSPLRAFRAYRFSPFYRTKENLSLMSTSHSHKINPACVMCPYDLQGTCNDDNCKQQHPKDYTLTEKEFLEDLVSYYPQIAGIKDDASPDVIRKAVGIFVTDFVAKHKGRMSLEELCLVLTLQASKVTEKNQIVTTKRRKWRPTPKKEQGLSIHLERKSSGKTMNSLEAIKSGPYNKDERIGDDDLRYFTGDGSELSSLEAGVVESPQNVSFWLQLSARKLADPNRSSQECLDQALNILARGLETNKSSSELWLQYLKLYQRHEQVTDVPQFCLMALEYAPSYELWILYFNTLKTYSDKEEACRGVLDYLLGQKDKVHISTQKSAKQPVVVKSSDVFSQEEKDGEINSQKLIELSHQTFEMIMFRISLSMMSGRFKTAIRFLQFTLGIKREDGISDWRLMGLLSGSDQIALWLVYVYALEWQQLPHGLIESCSNLPGKIICKTFMLPWSTKSKLNHSLETLVSLHLLACKVWSKAQSNKENMECQYSQVVKSLIDLLVSQQQQSRALSFCEKVLKDTHLVDVWILYTDLCDRVGNKDAPRQIFVRGLESNLLNPKLQFYQVLYLLNKNEKSEALHLLEQFVLLHFEYERSTLDPNLLFCHLLKQDVGLNFCQVKNSVPSDLHQNVFMWMCYCLLLELQGENQETIEVFERSLSHVMCASDLVIVWKSYISFLIRTGLLMQAWPEILTRSIISLPVKQPHQSGCGGTVVNYRHSNQIVDAWLRVVPASERIAVMEKCLDFMPGNVELMLRGLQLCIESGETRRAYCWCRMVMAQSDRPTNLSFWKMAIAFAHKEGSQSEVEQFLVRGVESMPLAVSAWKDFMLFEVSREDSEKVTQILSHCQQLGLNIEGFVATISAQN